MQGGWRARETYSSGIGIDNKGRSSSGARGKECLVWVDGGGRGKAGSMG